MIPISIPVYKYLGIPWKLGGRDLNGLDCWGLVWWLYKHEFKTSIDKYPNLNINNLKEVQEQIKNELFKWKATEAKNGCVVAMGRGLFVNHVGIHWNGGILHTYGRAKYSVYTPIHNLKFNIFGNYQWLQ